MRRIVSGGMAAALVGGLALAGCGSSGPKSLQAYCKDFKPINARVNADGNKLQGAGSTTQLKATLDDIVNQIQKALDANPPKSLKADIQYAHDAFVKFRTQLKGANYDISKLAGQNGPAIFNDPKFQKSGENLDNYGAKYCGIQPQNQNNGPSGPAPQAPSPDVIAIQNFQFSTNTVPAGTKVTVKNLDQAPHSVTADDKSFDSGIVNPGASGSFTAPTKAGTYPYHCVVHPQMHGTLTVS